MTWADLGSKLVALKSENKEVAAAAKAYGDKNIHNHVAVAFVTGDQGGTDFTYSTNGKSVTYQITVKIPGSHIDVALNEDIGHEGPHVRQDQAFAGSLKSRTLPLAVT